jgi:ABC-type antimicrobial peptide transport system permease subunit
MRVVGVVGAVSHGSLAEPPEPTYYVPFAQNPSARVTIVARTAAPPAAALAALAAVVGRLDERVPVSGASPYSRLLGASLAEARLLALMLLLFAGAALLLGGVGVYGVAAYSVRERVRDFGVRMALGARAREIRGEVLVDVAWLALPGLLAGLVLAPAAALLLGGLLYGVAALDPVTLVAVPVVLALTVAAAVAAPALRATRVDPARVLREG